MTTEGLTASTYDNRPTICSICELSIKTQINSTNQKNVLIFFVEVELI
jgi:hypothetical protein